MNRHIWTDRGFAILFGVTLLLIPSEDVVAQNTPSLDQPMTRMRPLGAPSAVDQYRRPATVATRRTDPSGSIRETAYQHRNSTGQVVQAVGNNSSSRPAVRQTVMWQGTTGANPGGGMGLPPFPNPTGSGGAVANPNLQTMPGNPGVGGTATGDLGGALNTNPRSLPSPPTGTIPQGSIVSPSDLAPMPAPQLGGGYANVANCNLISPPSSYSAASGIGCGCGTVIPTSYTAPPVTVPSAAVMPPAGAPLSQFQGGLLNPGVTGAPAPSLLTLGQQNYQVQVGQGLWGQPKAYVPGQGLRNWIRYFFP